MPANLLHPRIRPWRQRPQPVRPPAIGATPAGGVPILQNVLPGARLLVELLINSTWVDVSRDVLVANGGKVRISRGRVDEVSQTPPAGCSFTLKNPRGDYSSHNPLSVNYPYIRLNCQVRVSISLASGGGYVVLFWGFANGFTPTWDVTGKLSLVNVTASGVLRRLQPSGTSGVVPLHSALYRATLSKVMPTCYAYWSFEGQGTGNNIPSTIGGPPLVLDGSTTVSGTVTGPAGSDSISAFSVGDTFRRALAVGATKHGAGATGWTYQFWFRWDTTNSTIIIWGPRVYTSGTINSWLFQVDTTGTIIFSPQDSTGSPINGFFSVTRSSILDGNWHAIRVCAAQNGANVACSLYYDAESFPIINSNNITARADTLGRITKVGFTGNPALYWVSHFGVYGVGAFSAATSTTTGAPSIVAAGAGYTGETPIARLTRICGEEGIALTVYGADPASVLMGPQGIDNVGNIVRECEAAGAGFLYDGLSSGLTYQGLTARYNAPASMTLSAHGDIADPFTAIDNDLVARNRYTISRKNGGSATFEKTDGPLGTAAIGTYDSQLPGGALNVVDDTGLSSRASWEANRGTVPGLRYPNLTFRLDDRPAAVPALAAAWLASTPGVRIDATNVVDARTQHPVGTLELIDEGDSQEIDQNTWVVTLNCSSNLPYHVFILGDAQYGRLDTGGSGLHADAPAGSSSLVVDVTGSQMWTTTATYPGDFPLSIQVSGIQVTVTGITGTSSPQTFTVDPTTVTKDLHANDVVQLWRPGVIAL